MDKYQAKDLIIRRFEQNVKGRFPSKEELDTNHAGKIGHWLEAALGKEEHDADGDADFWGWECKKDSKNAMSWGDWGAPYRIFCDERFGFRHKSVYENQWQFVRIFGVFRNEDDRYSWSGKHVPTRCNDKTSAGMTLSLDSNHDISIYYNYYQDLREHKAEQVPDQLKQEKILLMRWHGTDNSFKDYERQVKEQRLPITVRFDGKNAAVSLEERVRRKFGVHGMFKGLYEKEGFYGLAFIDKILFQDWISYFINGDIIYDTALREGNRRPYNQWRSHKSFIDSLVKDVYQ